MKTHRSAQARVPNLAPNSNFDAGTALEHLRAEMIDVEALTRAAEAAADALPSPVTERQRLVFGRIQSLATKASQQASASLRFANAQVRSVRRADIRGSKHDRVTRFVRGRPPTISTSL